MSFNRLSLTQFRGMASELIESGPTKHQELYNRVVKIRKSKLLIEADAMQILNHYNCYVLNDQQITPGKNHASK